MQPSTPTGDTLAQRYTIAIDQLCEIARVYYFLGRSGDAQQLLRASLQLLDAPETTPQQRLKLSLLYGQVLIVDHFLTRGDAEPMWSTILGAKQLAEATHDRQGIADATSLIGQAHYFAAVVESRKQGTPLTSAPGQGKYDQALAYQQQALELREALHDTRGISESLFQIGVVYERWQQFERAQECYTQARQIADQHGHPFEKTEPARHVAFHALREGNLEQALPLALEALALREEAGFRPYQPLDHLLIYDVYLARGDSERAQHHARRAMEIAEELGHQAMVAAYLKTTRSA